MEKFVKTFRPKYLYHTTTVYNEKSKADFDELVEMYAEHKLDYTLPKFGEFPTRLNCEKYFTCTEKCDYYAPWCAIDQVFLRYKVLTPLTLFDMIEYTKVNKFSRCDSDIIKIVKTLKVDGYLDTEDCIEVRLFDASKHVKDFEVIEFVGGCDHDIDHEYSIMLNG